jgi:ABC-2 type transport system ATP-binding protein
LNEVKDSLVDFKDRERDLELEKIKSKIIDAIRFSEHYWMIYKEKTFGIATVIDLIYKKSYIEILFFTNKDVLQRGEPLVKIYTPSKTIFDFHEVLIEPDFESDGLISPIKIIERVDNLIQKEINYHFTILNYELDLINEKFESYPIDDNIFFRKLFAYFPHYVIELRINFENYPELPNFSDARQLIVKRFKEPLREVIKGKLVERYGIVSLEKYGEEVIVYDDEIEIYIEKSRIPYLKKLERRVLNKIKTFFKSIRKTSEKEKESYNFLDELLREKNFNNLEIVENWEIENPPHVIEIIEAILNLEKNSQQLILKNVSIDEKITDLNVKIHRGQSIGIFYDYEDDTENPVLTLFNVIKGKGSQFSGDISIFGEHLIPGKKNKIEDCFLATEHLDVQFENMTTRKALLHNIYILGKRKSKKQLINRALETTGLLNRKKEKISNFSNLDKLLFSISRALVRKIGIIMIEFPNKDIGQQESETLSRCFERIKEEFHLILIIHGPKSIISQCDKIITIKDRKAEIGTIKQYVSKIPQSGEIITVELDNPDKSALEKMLEIKTAIFIEERKNERYKLYCIRESPDKILIKLFETIGDYIYNFKRHQASLGEYLEFMEIKEKINL